MKFILKFLLLITFTVIGAFPESSYAAEDENPGAFVEFLMSIEEATKGVVNDALGKDFIERVKQAALSKAEATTTIALSLGGAIALLTLIWSVMILMLSRQSVVGATVEVLLYGLIAAALITQYSTLVDQIFSIAMSLLSAIGLDVGSTLSEFLQSFFLPLAAVFRRFGEDSAPWYSFEFLKISLDMLGTLVLTAIVIVLLLSAIVSLLSVLLVGPIFFGVGIIFGPIMIATLVSSFTRQWFNQWLNFMIGSAFLTTVAIAVVSLLTGVIGVTAQRLGAGGSGLLAMAGLVLLAATTGKIFESVPAITDAIFPGRTGAGRALNMKMGATMASATGTVIDAAAMAANPASSAKNGIKSALAGAQSAAGAVKNSDVGKGAGMAARTAQRGYSAGSGKSNEKPELN